MNNGVISGDSMLEEENRITAICVNCRRLRRDQWTKEKATEEQYKKYGHVICSECRSKDECFMSPELKKAAESFLKNNKDVLDKAVLNLKNRPNVDDYND